MLTDEELPERWISDGEWVAEIPREQPDEPQAIFKVNTAANAANVAADHNELLAELRRLRAQPTEDRRDEGNLLVDLDELREQIRIAIQRHLWGGTDYPDDEAECCADEVISVLRSQYVTTRRTAKPRQHALCTRRWHPDEIHGEHGVIGAGGIVYLCPVPVPTEDRPTEHAKIFTEEPTINDARGAGLSSSDSARELPEGSL